MHTNSPCLPYTYLSFPNLNNEQTHPHSESMTSSQLVDSQRSTEPSFSTIKVKLFTTGTAQYKAFKITISTIKVKLFTTVVHIKQRTQLAKKFTATNGYFVSESILCQKYFMLNHTQGCLLHAACSLTYKTYLRSVESIASLDTFSLSRTAVLALSLWSFPANSLSHKPRGVIWSVYGNIKC